MERTILVIGQPNVSRNILEVMDASLSSKLLVVSPFNALDREKLSGRRFVSIIVLEGARNAPYFHDFHSIALSRLI